MKKELKRQIKQDDLRTGVEHAGLWAQGHSQELRIGLIAAAVLVALFAGVNYLQKYRQAQAEGAFAEALLTFHAPVKGEEATPAPAGIETFETAAQKFEKAMAAFDGVERRFRSSVAGQRARYYSALCRLELGKFAEAEKDLKDLAEKGADGDLEKALARLALAESARRQGRTEEAVTAYRRLIDDQKQPLPRDHALMRLATLLEETERRTEAGASYRRLAEEFPRSVYATEARRRADSLDVAQQG